MLFFASAAFFFVFLCAILIYLTMPGPLNETTVVIIEPKTYIRTIAKDLAAQNVISSPFLFNAIATIYSRTKNTLKSGEYEFTSRISPLQVIRALSIGQTVVHKFSVPEGSTVHDVVSRLKMERRLLGEIDEEITEGFLLPATYFYSFRDNRHQMLRQMKRQMSAVLDELMPKIDPDSPVQTRLEVLTLASIVEKEALFDDEKPRIAGVFLNRMKIGMKLQADPTTIYGLTEGKAKLGRLLTRADLKVKSDYNTYHIFGLPPTPIACPGIKSIKAVISPQKTDDIYFVVDGTGRHKFSRNLTTHTRNIMEYKNSLRSTTEK